MIDSWKDAALLFGIVSLLSSVYFGTMMGMLACLGLIMLLLIVEK